MYDASYNENYLSILIYLQDAVSFSSGGGHLPCCTYKQIDLSEQISEDYQA